MTQWMTIWTAALVALGLAGMSAPVMAQTVTAPGLKGPQACLGTSEVNRFDLAEATNITSSAARFSPKSVSNLYAQLRAESGDGGPTSFPIRYTVHNAKSGLRQGAYVIGSDITSSNPNFSASPENGSYPAKTPHYFTVFTTAAGFGEGRPLTRRCFMTGGTYTTSTLSSGTSGCFSISPRTPQDVKNCLCGRGTGGLTNYSSDMRSAWGCAN